MIFYAIEARAHYTNAISYIHIDVNASNSDWIDWINCFDDLNGMQKCLNMASVSTDSNCVARAHRVRELYEPINTISHISHLLIHMSLSVQHDDVLHRHMSEIVFALLSISFKIFCQFAAIHTYYLSFTIFPLGTLSTTALFLLPNPLQLEL